MHRFLCRTLPHVSKMCTRVYTCTKRLYTNSNDENWIRLGNGRYVKSNIQPEVTRSGDNKFLGSLEMEVCNNDTTNKMQVKMTLSHWSSKNQKNIDAIVSALTMEKVHSTGDLQWHVDLDDYASVIKQLQTRMATLRDDIYIRYIPDFVLSLATQVQSGVALPTLDETQTSLSFLPKHMNDSLLPFQRQGIHFGVKSCGGRIFFGDEMGLGKTIQALGVAYHYRKEWPLLIVCPSALRLNWKKEFMKWTDVKESEINIIESVAQDRILDPQFSVHIISYDLLAREDMLEKMKQIPKKFKVVICDESHFLKNPMAKRTKAVKPLIKNAKRAILMSGTATPSRPLELYDQIKSLFNKSFKLRKSQYGTRYCGLKMTYFGADYSGASHLNELNTLLIKLGFLRRKKDQVMNQLPKKLRQHVYLPVFDTKTGTTSETITEDQLDAVSPDLIRRFAHSGVAKLPHVCAYIRERFLQTGNEEKFLVFAHHKKVMDGIEKELIRNKTGYIRIDGETPNQSREELANQFRTEDKCQVALLSITVAGTGLNFVPCSTVVFAELFWNPGTLQQAEDRVHRIGQVASCVNVHYLLGEGTLDDVIWPLIHRKLSVVGMTLDGNVQTLNSQRS